ncbi:Arc family DNA-binding protein [Salmonella enterica subsp. enterica serovar Schwarzengrund]|nr:Arc family DNA-binding protein [Salmonella enterica subsp. enterica serovar Schwarzengrund]
MEKEVNRILVRMPQSLKDAITGKAKEECRSFNSEVIKRLLDSLKREGITV